MHSYPKETSEKFRGTGVALVTPFTSDLRIDREALIRLVNHVIDGGVEFLVSMGTTGESATLSAEERFALIDMTVEAAAGRVPVVAGFGGNNTAQIIAEIKKYNFKGVDGILSTSPYYNKPSQEGIYHHYRAIDAACPLPLIIYNVPGRTSSNIASETTVRLARDCDHVIGIKEASGNIVQCMEIIRDAPGNFLVLSGDDPETLPYLSIGMCGVISVVANAYPALFSEMVRQGLKNNFPQARQLHYKLLHFIRLLFREGSPAGIKCALRDMGICGDAMRPPLWPVSENLESAIAQAISDLGGNAS